MPAPADVWDEPIRDETWPDPTPDDEPEERWNLSEEDLDALTEGPGNEVTPAGIHDTPPTAVTRRPVELRRFVVQAILSERQR